MPNICSLFYFGAPLNIESRCIVDIVYIKYLYGCMLGFVRSPGQSGFKDNENKRGPAIEIYPRQKSSYGDQNDMNLCHNTYVG